MTNIKFFTLKSSKNTLRGAVHSCSDNVIMGVPIIFVHGYFSANRNGPQRLFVKMANILAKNGYTAYRFDFSGMGESDGDISQIKFSDHVNDLNNIVNFVTEKHKCGKVNLIAHSLGCNIALKLLEQHSNFIEKVLFLAPFLTDDTSLHMIFSKREARELTENSFTFRRGLYSDLSYFTNSQVENFLTSIKSTETFYNIIAAEDDQFIPSDLTKQVLSNISNARVEYMANADHNFLNVHQELISHILEIF